jgi:hypothetical protein
VVSACGAAFDFFSSLLSASGTVLAFSTGFLTSTAGLTAGGADFPVSGLATTGVSLATTPSVLTASMASGAFPLHQSLHSF